MTLVDQIHTLYALYTLYTLYTLSITINSTPIQLSHKDEPNIETVIYI